MLHKITLIRLFSHRVHHLWEKWQNVCYTFAIKWNPTFVFQIWCHKTGLIQCQNLRGKAISQVLQKKVVGAVQNEVMVKLLLPRERRQWTGAPTLNWSHQPLVQTTQLLWVHFLQDVKTITTCCHFLQYKNCETAHNCKFLHMINIHEKWKVVT